MFLATAHAERLLKETREKPLKDGEIRRVVGLGELYFALSSTKVEPNYEWVYTMFIDDIEYTFYNCREEEVT